MVIEQTNTEVIIRLPLDIGTFELEKVTRYLKYRESVKDSTATEEEINQIAGESKKRWWKENKTKYIK